MTQFRAFLKIPLLDFGCGNVDLDFVDKIFMLNWANRDFAKDKIILENPASSVQSSHNEIKILSCPVVRTQLLVAACN